jgi:hypothetical protein
MITLAFIASNEAKLVDVCAALASEGQEECPLFGQSALQ